jgi:hypothetical protein
MFNSPWPGTALAVAAYVLSYFLGLRAARLYRDGAQARLVYRDGFPFEREYLATLARGRPVSGRFAAIVLVLAAALPLAWEATVRRLAVPELFAALVGGLVLMEAADCLEHVRSAVLLRHARSGEHVSGRLELSNRVVFSLRYAELYALAVMFGLSFFVSGSWFFAGGALGCLVAAQRWRDWVIVRT